MSFGADRSTTDRLSFPRLVKPWHSRVFFGGLLQSRDCRSVKDRPPFADGSLGRGTLEDEADVHETRHLPQP